MTQPKVALLPLYLKLYDDTAPKRRSEFAGWLEDLARGLQECGLEVLRCDVCRLRGEFAAAAASALAWGAEAIVSLHLAYSPSLESADVLAASPLPLILLDTTMDHDFGQDVDPARLFYNHGVHGVQDLANLLRRRGKPFEIVAGHWRESRVLARAADLARAAAAAARLRSTRAVRIGSAFAGMGDFAVAPDVLDRLGVNVQQAAVADLARHAPSVTDEMVQEELEADRRRFDVQAPQAAHRRSVRVGLALRHFLQERGCSAFSANFQAFDSPQGPIDTVPFLEISKAMERGIGYAGEGDVLTAALVGALLWAWPRTTFTEIFCPDWKGGSLFLSHMGEINPAVASGRPVLCEKDFPYTPAQDPVFLAAAPAPGPATLVNLAPGPAEALGLIVAPVEVLEDGRHPGYRSCVRGWIRPACGVEEFLERYSRLGGTHHSALVLGDRAEALAAFARSAGLGCSLIQ